MAGANFQREKNHLGKNIFLARVKNHVFLIFSHRRNDAPERARAETGGADQRVLKPRECSGFAMVHKVTSAFLGYPLSVFNENSSLKRIRK